MTKVILYAIFFTLSLFSCNTTTKTEGKTEETSVIKIENNVNNIEKLEDISKAYQITVSLIKEKSVDSSSFNYNCAGEKSGTVVYYQKDSELIMIEKRYAEYSHTEGKDQYFIKEGKPFFVYKKDTNWHFASNSEMEGATIDKVNEKRFYIVKNDLVRCLQKDYEIHSSTKQILSPSQVSNSNTSCPSLNALLADYEKLLTYKKQKTHIACF